MDINLTEEQEMLRTTARDFLAIECPPSLVREMAKDERGCPPELWRKMAEAGWMGLPFPEEYGGTGSNFLDLAVLLEEMGYACLPGPFFSTVVLGGMTILDMGNDSQKQELLPRIVEGDMLVTLALTEASARYDIDSVTVTATAEGNNYVINGTKLFVPDAHIADYIICVARTGKGVTPFLIETKNSGINCTLLKTIGGDKQCEVVFDKVKVSGDSMLGDSAGGKEKLESALRKATVAKCAEMVGGAQRVLDMTLDYAKTRMAFGRPIGSFQIIQHYCANMWTDLEACRFLTYEAAWKLSEGLAAVKETAIAKAFTSEAFRRIGAISHQIHGAIGISEDHDLPMYFKRAKAAEVTLGDADFHRELVATGIGL